MGVKEGGGRACLPVPMWRVHCWHSIVKRLLLQRPPSCPLACRAWGPRQAGCCSEGMLRRVHWNRHTPAILPADTCGPMTLPWSTDGAPCSQGSRPLGAGLSRMTTWQTPWAWCVWGGVGLCPSLQRRTTGQRTCRAAALALPTHPHPQHTHAARGFLPLLLLPSNILWPPTRWQPLSWCPPHSITLFTCTRPTPRAPTLACRIPQGFCNVGLGPGTQSNEIPSKVFAVWKEVGV